MNSASWSLRKELTAWFVGVNSGIFSVSFPPQSILNETPYFAPVASNWCLSCKNMAPPITTAMRANRGAGLGVNSLAPVAVGREKQDS